MSGKTGGAVGKILKYGTKHGKENPESMRMMLLENVGGLARPRVA